MFGLFRPRSKALGTIKGLFAALDVGSANLTCLVCYSDGSSNFRVLGMGARRADGLYQGNIIDSALAQQSILNVINQAEELAGETIEKVVLSTNAGRPNSRLLELELEVEGSRVNQAHLDSLASYANAPTDQELTTDQTDIRERRLLTRPISYSLDGQDGIMDPRGMHSQSLVAKFIAASANNSAIQSLVDCIERCHLQVIDVIASPLAAAYGSLSEEERLQGTTVIDLGAQCTGIAAFHGGSPVHLEVLPAGSDVLTSDLSAALGCTMADAERVKCLHGAAFLRPTDGSVDIEVASIDPYEAPTRVNRAYLVDVLQARLDELFDKIARRLDHPKLLPYTAKRIVLTGGGSGLVGMKDYVALRLGRATRLGRPATLDGLSHIRLQPTHAGSVGTVQYLQQSQNALKNQNRSGALPSAVAGRRHTFNYPSTQGELGKV